MKGNSKVTRAEFDFWSETEIREINVAAEYDAQTQKIIIKAKAGPVHQSAADTVNAWFRQVVERKMEADGSRDYIAYSEISEFR